MNKILQDLINTKKVASFIDDVIVEIEKGEEHNKVVEEVVKQLVENNLYVKIEEERMKGVLSQPIPKEVKDIQKFLELTNYYWQVIKDFASIARLLHNLVKKDQKWNQTEKQKEAFKELKRRFTKELVLTAPDIDKKVRMKVDILDYVTEDILSIECKNGKQRPIACLSKSLNKTERNYEIHNKEMLVMMRGLENWRYLLEGTKFKFEV